FLILIFLVIIVVSKRITLKMVRFFKKYLLRGFFGFIEKELNVFYEALPLFKNKRIYQTVVPLTLLGWFFDFLAFYFIFTSVFQIYFLDVIVSQVINIGASLVTFIPGGWGTSEIGSVYMLNLFGYSVVLSTAAILLVRLFTTSILLISGLIGSLLLKKKNND
ncbi:flippase-like domain-containing protein, partial [Patescibacteria group bacterium]|nr:flippase-like domain-containing protein [Patescibacteria group bacterium]